MDYTQNLHLPQWEADDRILRTDFNEAMASIDAAVTESALWRTIFDVTTTEAANQFDVSLNGIDLTDYAEIRLKICAPGCSYIQLRTNGISDSSYHYTGNGDSSYPYSNNSSNSLVQIEPTTLFFFFPPQAGQPVALAQFRLLLQGSAMVFSRAARTAPVNWEDLRTINFVNSNGIPIGSRFTLYGLK